MDSRQYLYSMEFKPISVLSGSVKNPIAIIMEGGDGLQLEFPAGSNLTIEISTGAAVVAISKSIITKHFHFA